MKVQVFVNGAEDTDYDIDILACEMEALPRVGDLIIDEGVAITYMVVGVIHVVRKGPRSGVAGDVEIALQAKVLAE